MTIRLGINGFGRIGRTILRVLAQSGRTDMQVVAINDPAPAEALAHLFEFDSLHGRFGRPVTLSENHLDIGSNPIAITSFVDPNDMNWPDVDVVLECSGQMTHRDKAAQHLRRGARRVLISAPGQGDVKTICYGVNQDKISATDLILSNASCTTNCLAPVAIVLHEAFGIERGMMTTVHCYTNTQSVHDAPHPDIYRARAAALSMVPTSSGAATALGHVMPELAGRITGQAIRVPAPNVSCIDLTVDVANPTTVQDVNALFVDASHGLMAGIVAVTDEKLVSSDYKRDSHSAIVALDQTRLQGDTLVRVLAWYDNEWGFANRMLDVSKQIFL